MAVAKELEPAGTRVHVVLVRHGLKQPSRKIFPGTRQFSVQQALERIRF
jgi:hypothetical protein